MATVMVIAIGIVVVVIPIGAAATTDTTIRTRHHRRRIWAPIGGVVVDDDAVVAGAPAAPLLPLSGVMDPTATALTKTHDGTTSAAARVTALVMEEEEYNEWEGANPRRRLDDTLFRLADRILLHWIAAMPVGMVAAAMTVAGMPAIDVGALFIGQEEPEGNAGSGVATEDNDDADMEAGKYTRNYLKVALSQLWEGLFGRRTTTAKTMETCRDDEHEHRLWRRRRATVDVRDALRGVALGDASRPSSPPAAASGGCLRKTRFAPHGRCCCRHLTALLCRTWRGQRQ